jgi:hypothetical protein
LTGWVGCSKVLTDMKLARRALIRNVVVFATR